MKIIVDKMPTKPNECFFSEWHPLPPICKKTGYFKCKMTSKVKETVCDVETCSCPYLKEEERNYSI